MNNIIYTNLIPLSGNESEEEINRIREIENAFNEVGNKSIELMESLAQLLLSGQELPESFTKENIVKMLQAGENLDIPKISFIIGMLYIAGKGMEQDVQKGISLVRKAADQGLSTAQVYLGQLYRDGKVVPKNDAKATIYFRRAAMQGDANAMFFLGSTYSLSDRVPRSYKTAEFYLRNAVQNDRNNEMYRQFYDLTLQALDTPEGKKNAESGLSKRIYNAETGSMKARYDLALQYLDGNGVTPDDEQAAEWCRLSADQGYLYAENLLGTLYLNGRGIDQDAAKAVECFRKSVQQDYAPAMEQLGLCYKNGAGVEQNYAMALEWFRKGADLRHHDSALQMDMRHRGCAYQLALMYKDGLGVPRDLEKTMEFLLQANHPLKPGRDYQFHGDAAYTIAEMYEKGEGVEQSSILALWWYHHASEAYNNPNPAGRDAENRLLKMAEKWENEPNPELRDPRGFDTYLAKFVLREAQHGSITRNMMDLLGKSYYYGANTGKDLAQALYWLHRAEEAGTHDPDIWSLLGDISRDGNGVPQDYQKAADYYRTAIEFGGRYARTELANLYERGLGVPQDYDQALALYLEAAEYDEDAASGIERIRALLKQQRAQARKGFFSKLFGR